MELVNRISKENIREFVLAGNSLFTLQSGNTNKHYTYRIVRCKDKENLYFVNRLSNTDNEADYQYIGSFYDDNDYFYPTAKYRKLDRLSWPTSLRTIAYFLDKLDDMPDNLYVFHHGRCARCGRLLTTPESIQRGLGPECSRK